MFKNRYRVVRDGYLGYEVQIKYWWLPMWWQVSNGGPTNTHSTLGQAKKFIDNHKRQGVAVYIEQ